ncbi:Nn.00g097060.m01.CDS01 [Neocucurbitaria sp. VM-36]
MKSLTLLALPSLALAALSSTTQNDVTNGGACKAMTVLFARGTTETGNMGTIAGPPFVSAIGDLMGGAANVAVQGIEYPANIPGFLAGGDKAGSMLMAQMVGEVRAKCPDTALVMAGYSQGGQLVHNAADMLSAQDSAFVSSAVIFGDPDNGDAVGKVAAANTKIICATGDLICAGQAIVLAPHLSYGQNANEAAQFVINDMAARGAGAAAQTGGTTKRASTQVKYSVS